MAWDGAGQFSRTNGTQTGATTWADARDSGDNILAADHDTHDEDLATGIEACLAKNGENEFTGSVSVGFRGSVDNTVDLGTSAKRWRRLYLSGYIGDGSGNEILTTSSVASAVNEVTVTNAATGKQPSVAATGETNVDLLLKGKGTGGVNAALLGHLGMIGGKLSYSANAGALTIAVKTHAGNDPSATEPVHVLVRDATVSVDTLTVITITAATSMSLTSGSTLGTTSGVFARVWVVGFNDGGTFRLGAINCRDSTNSIFKLSGHLVASSTAEGGAGAADSAHVFYTGTAVTSMPYAILGWGSYTNTTAGTWVAPVRTQMYGPGVPLPGTVIQNFRSASGAVQTGTTRIVYDDTIPQNTEGDEYYTQAISPTNQANVLEIESRVNLSDSASTVVAAALFQDTTADALAVGAAENGGAAYVSSISLRHRMAANAVAATTFKIRAGGQTAGTTTVNGFGGARKFGGVFHSWLEVREIMA